MTRKCHVRFGGGFEEKCFGKQSNSPHSYPTTIPIMIMIMMAVFQFGILVYATQMTQEAARHGARMGSVVQAGGGADVARSEAAAYIHRALPIGNPRVNILAPGGIVGSYLRVRVSCTVPNYMGSLVPGLPPHWDVNGEATFRQEGW